VMKYCECDCPKIVAVTVGMEWCLECGLHRGDPLAPVTADELAQARSMEDPRTSPYTKGQFWLEFGPRLLANHESLLAEVARHRLGPSPAETLTGENPVVGASHIVEGEED